MLQYPYPIRLTSMWEKTMRQLSERFSSCRTQQEYTQVGMKIFRFFRTEGHRFDLAILHPKSTVLRWKCSAFLFASADADNAVRLALSTLKPKIAGALEHQFSDVALHEHSVVRTIYFEFHPVAAFHLKGRIIGRERMHHRIVRMVARNFRALCHHRCRNGQPRRMVVFIPCADISDDGV